VSDKLRDYLEKQIILDFHFRGEQDVFEAEYSYLVDKAVSFIGPSFYFELSECIGAPLHEKHMSHYSKLM
jgi:hypothetical protein